MKKVQMDICISRDEIRQVTNQTSGRFISYDEYLKIISAN